MAPESKFVEDNGDFVALILGTSGSAGGQPAEESPSSLFAGIQSSCSGGLEICIAGGETARGARATCAPIVHGFYCGVATADQGPN